MVQTLAFRRYFSSSSRDWVVLLPGAGAASAVWRRQIPFFRQRYNLIVVDLPGHGRSPKEDFSKPYTFESIASRMIALLEREGVDRAHFLSMSLGGLVAEAIGLLYPERMSSMILAGGIAKLDWWATLLMYLGRATSLLMPYMALYRIFAWIIMPGARHARTRLLFYAHAQRLGREEFLRWYRLSSEVKTLLSRSANRPAPIPSLFVMGADDYMFLPQAVERARSRTDTTVATIGNCGHVCSVERPDEFNRVVEEFLQALKSR